jgi:hypothetical protein
MAKILRMSDRLNFKIGSVEFIIAPLSNDRKLELAQCMRYQGGEQEYDLLRAQHLYVKYGLKGMKGVEDCEGNDYELEFEGDCLTDDCVSEVFYLEEKTLFLTAAWQVLNGLTNTLVDPVSGKKLKGVELKVEKSEKK